MLDRRRLTQSRAFEGWKPPYLEQRKTARSPSALRRCEEHHHNRAPNRESTASWGSALERVDAHPKPEERHIQVPSWDPEHDSIGPGLTARLHEIIRRALGIRLQSYDEASGRNIEGPLRFPEESGTTYRSTSPRRKPRSERVIARVQAVTNDTVFATVREDPYGGKPIQIPAHLFPASPHVGEHITVGLIAQASLPVRTAQETSSAETSSESNTQSPLDAAYADLDALLVQRHIQQGPDPALEKQIEATWARLEELQDATYEKARKELDASVELPLDELTRLAEKAHALLNEDS